MAEISRLKGARHPDIFRLPDHWRNELYENIEPNKDYTVKKIISVGGRSVFWNRPMIIDILPASSNGIKIGINNDLHPADLKTVGNSKSSLKTGNVRVYEHTWAMALATGLKADFDLTEDSFPNFNGGIYEILSEIHPHLKVVWDSKFITVQEPIGIIFDNWGYIIIEPDDGQHKVIMDHQFSHKNALGIQRTIINITPTNFAFLSSARPPAYGIRTIAAKALCNNLNGFPLLWWLNKNNIVFVDSKKIINGNPKFNDSKWVNREILMHEAAQDKPAPFKLLDGRFVGKVTTYRTNHAMDLEAVKIISKNLEYEK